MANVMCVLMMHELKVTNWCEIRHNVALYIFVKLTWEICMTYKFKLNHFTKNEIIELGEQLLANPYYVYSSFHLILILCPWNLSKLFFLSLILKAIDFLGECYKLFVRSNVFEVVIICPWNVSCLYAANYIKAVVNKVCTLYKYLSPLWSHMFFFH